MGFKCKVCGEREVFAFESSVYPSVCWDCDTTYYGIPHERNFGDGPIMYVPPKPKLPPLPSEIITEVEPVTQIQIVDSPIQVVDSLPNKPSNFISQNEIFK